MTDMRRREFITALGGMTVAWSVVTRAQQPMKKIGFLSVSSPGPHAPFVAAFNEGLKEVGFIEGQNLAIEYSWAEGNFDRLPALAADLIHNKVDVIAAMSGDVSIRAAIRASSTIPVVFITGSDPVQTGLVASLARPGGNVTGLSMIATELMAKRFELLSELVPQIRTIALLINPKYHSATEGTIPLVQQAATVKGVRLHILKATDEDEFEFRLRRSRPSQGRRANCWDGPLLHQPPRADCSLGIAILCSGNLRMARICNGGRSYQLWGEPHVPVSRGWRLRRQGSQRSKAS